MATTITLIIREVFYRNERGNSLIETINKLCVFLAQLNFQYYSVREQREIKELLSELVRKLKIIHELYKKL